MDEVEKALWELRLRAEEIWQANWRRLNNKKDDVYYWPYDWEWENENRNE